MARLYDPTEGEILLDGIPLTELDPAELRARIGMVPQDAFLFSDSIAGNIGLLGEDYPGIYPVEDADALRCLLERAEGESGFLETLKRHCRERRFLFRPGAEFTAWKDLVQRLTRPE